ncbi:MAG TPA: hypothetical protein VKN63_12030 [Afifellaceae bacterium]|nr:hypothetical protein [Afifellaceae bacterium]
MNALIRVLAISLLVFLAGCGGDATAPQADADASTAGKSATPEIDFIHLQIATLNKFADELGTIKSPSDAQRVKKSAAAEFIKLYGARGRDRDRFDQKELARVLAKSGLFRDYLAAQQRVGEAMSRLSEDHPESYRIVAIEISKLYAAQR